MLLLFQRECCCWIAVSLSQKLLTYLVPSLTPGKIFEAVYVYRALKKPYSWQQ